MSSPLSPHPSPFTPLPSSLSHCYSPTSQILLFLPLVLFPSPTHLTPPLTSPHLTSPPLPSLPSLNPPQPPLTYGEIDKTFLLLFYVSNYSFCSRFAKNFKCAGLTFLFFAIFSLLSSIRFILNTFSDHL